jgi:hypothetical protein
MHYIRILAGADRKSRPMKVRPSVKKICEKCRVIRRRREDGDGPSTQEPVGDSRDGYVIDIILNFKDLVAGPASRAFQAAGMSPSLMIRSGVPGREGLWLGFQRVHCTGGHPATPRPSSGQTDAQTQASSRPEGVPE